MKWIGSLMTPVAAIGLAASAQAAPLNSLTVSGGNFFMGGYGGTLHPAAFASMSVDGATYDGSAPAVIPGSEADLTPTSIATFTYGFFGPAAVITAQTDYAGNGPFPGVTGDLTGTTLTLDLRS